MQLKQTTDYAVRALTYLARDPKRTVPTGEIAKAMKIPQNYLLHVGRALRDRGLITTCPGAAGGYRLAREAGEIRLYDVLCIMEGTMKMNRCLEEDGDCSRKGAGRCQTYRYYRVMQRVWESFFCGITIADLLMDDSEEEIEARLRIRTGE